MTDPEAQREREELERRIKLEIRTQTELENIAREVGSVKETVLRTEAKVEEIDRRPPQVYQWSEKVAKVEKNAAAIARLEPQVANHSAALRWIGGVLTIAIAGILLRWGWLVLQNGVGMG